MNKKELFEQLIKYVENSISEGVKILKYIESGEDERSIHGVFICYDMKKDISGAFIAKLDKNNGGAFNILGMHENTIKWANNYLLNLDKESLKILYGEKRD